MFFGLKVFSRLKVKGKKRQNSVLQDLNILDEREDKMFQKFHPIKQMQLSYRKVLLVFFVLLYTSPAFAQLDSIRYRIETQAAISTQGYLPLWIVSNRYGVLEDETDALVSAGFEVPYTNGKKFDISYGLDFLGKKNLGNSRMQQGFLKIKYGVFELRGGRIEETTGLVHEALSSGSLAQSRNAIPIPKIAFTMPDYAAVPFTKGYLEFKGYLGHGWLGRGRFVENAYLHEKNLYIKAGGNLPVNLYGGFVHYAIWGGVHPQRGTLPSGVKDYSRVFTGKGAVNAGKWGQHQSEVDNALGNHLGIYDFGLVSKFKKYKLSVYHQTPWEDLTSLKLFKNKDRLLGVGLQYNERKLISEVLYEYLHTKYQSGPGTPDPIPGQSNYGYPYGGRDDYYNNGLYASGWTYKNRIIGTPLFITNLRAKNYFHEDEIKVYGSKSIMSTRIVAHHLGIGGYINQYVSYRAKATYSRNYGTYAGLNLGGTDWASRNPDVEVDYVFDPPLNQAYFLLEVKTILPFNENLTLQTSVGFDVGEFSRNVGIFLGLQWNGVLRCK